MKGIRHAYAIYLQINRRRCQPAQMTERMCYYEKHSCRNALRIEDSITLSVIDQTSFDTLQGRILEQSRVTCVDPGDLDGHKPRRGL